MSDLKLLGLAMLIFTIVMGFWIISGFISSDLRCIDFMGERACIQNTIRSTGNGKCTCTTKTGNIEWSLGTGCDLD